VSLILGHGVDSYSTMPLTVLNYQGLGT